MLKKRVRFLTFFYFVLSSCSGNLEAYKAASRFNATNKMDTGRPKIVKVKDETKVPVNKTGFSGACGGGYYKIGDPYAVLGKTYYPKEYKEYKETGLASWYGEAFHNKQTANGEIFNMNDLTAAHKTLPLPSIVRVTNLGSGKSIVVRVNDRGPFADGKNRILDLSKRASQEIGFEGRGVLEVRVELLPDETMKYRKKCGLI